MLVGGGACPCLTARLTAPASLPASSPRKSTPAEDTIKLNLEPRSPAPCKTTRHGAHDLTRRTSSKPEHGVTRGGTQGARWGRCFSGLDPGGGLPGVCCTLTSHTLFYTCVTPSIKSVSQASGDDALSPLEPAVPAAGPRERARTRKAGVFGGHCPFQGPRSAPELEGKSVRQASTQKSVRTTNKCLSPVRAFLSLMLRPPHLNFLLNKNSAHVPLFLSDRPLHFSGSPGSGRPSCTDAGGGDHRGGRPVRPVSCTPKAQQEAPPPPPAAYSTAGPASR